MNIFDFAIQLKKQKEQYYRDLSEKVQNQGLKNVLSMLADEEHQHCQATEHAKAKTPAKIANTTILSGARACFEKMKNSGEKIDINVSEAGIYRKAMQLEEKSFKFYEKKAEQVENENQKEIFKKIAEEDKKHYFLLENIMDFVARPQSWLENAEFCQLEEY